MENNEQLTQNPAIEVGIENATTSNASKKAIDGNEKNEIVKLIQPSILPDTVKIEVATLVAERNAEPAPLADEVMPEMVDVAEPDEEDLVEDNADLDGLNKLQLVEMLEELVQNPDVQSIKDKVAAIRLHFNKLNKEDLDNELDQFLQGGGEAESFQHAEDPVEQRFNAAFGIFKANRAKQNEDMEKQKIENLAKKQAIDLRRFPWPARPLERDWSRACCRKLQPLEQLPLPRGEVLRQGPHWPRTPRSRHEEEPRCQD